MLLLIGESSAGVALSRQEAPPARWRGGLSGGLVTLAHNRSRRGGRFGGNGCGRHVRHGTRL